MAQEAVAQEPQLEGIDYRPAEETVSPGGFNVVKLDVPNPEDPTNPKKEVRVQFFVGLPNPGGMVITAIKTYRMSEDHARELAKGLTGGIHLSNAIDLAELKK